MKLHTLLLMSGTLFVGLAVRHAAASDAPPQTVAHVDLQRYMGRWYEIARYPNRFERKCVEDITATYELRPDGRVSVVNSCGKATGGRSVASGWAKVIDTATNAKLRVTFFWPFFGDYWVLELGRNYEYAVIGEPSGKYLWILSRTPQMDEVTYSDITGRLAANGYDAARLIRVKQTSAE